MRAKCSVYGCKSATYNKQGLDRLFHRFPKDVERRQIWARFCKNSKTVSKSHKNLWICSRHFEKSMYCNGLLRRSAIPTRNPPRKYDKELDEDDLKYVGDIQQASVSAAKSELEDKPESGRKKIQPTTEVRETNVEQMEDDCESVTFSSEDEVSEEDVVSNNDDENSIMDFVKEEYQPMMNGSTSNEPVAIGSKLSLGDDTVQPVYQSTIGSKLCLGDDTVQPVYQSTIGSKLSLGDDTVQPVYQSTIGSKLSLGDDTVQPVYQSTTAVYETPLNNSVQMEVLPQISSIRSAASPASVTNVELDDDDCGTFAAHIKARMRNFSSGQKIIAQKLISDIMFMADLQQLQMSSTVVHVQSQPVAPPDVPPAVKRPRGSFLAYLGSDDDNRPSTSKMKK